MSVVKNILNTQGDFVLEIPHWEIADQGVTALVGPSGSGKTTLLRVLLGLESGGAYSWDFQGDNLAELSPGRRRLGVVFQNYQLFPHLTARENVFFAAEARRLDSRKALNLWQHLADSLNLEQFALRRPAQLSGGEQQRVALARALMSQPRMLLLDEPFSAMDIQLREDSRLLVAKVLEQSKIPALLITHDDQDLSAFRPVVTKLRAGRLVD